MCRKSFSKSRCKSLLKSTLSRIKLLTNKRAVQTKQLRRDVAQLLQAGQEQSARMRLDLVWKEQSLFSAYYMIGQFCEQVVANVSNIAKQGECPLGLKETVASLIFAASICADLPELQELRELFVMKYGKEYAIAIAERRPDCHVNREIIEKLSTRAPSEVARQKLMEEIAAEHNVKWDPSPKADAELPKPLEDLHEVSRGQLHGSQRSKPDLLDIFPPPRKGPSLAGPHNISGQSSHSPVSNGHDLNGYKRAQTHSVSSKASQQCRSSDSDEERNNHRVRANPVGRPSNPNRYDAASQAPPGSKSSRQMHVKKGHSGIWSEGELDYTDDDLEGEMKYADVVAAAEAAAEAADRASEAAQAAARLAQRASFKKALNNAGLGSSSKNDDELNFVNSSRYEFAPGAAEMSRHREGDGTYRLSYGSSRAVSTLRPETVKEAGTKGSVKHLKQTRPSSTQLSDEVQGDLNGLGVSRNHMHKGSIYDNLEQTTIVRKGRERAHEVDVELDNPGQMSHNLQLKDKKDVIKMRMSKGNSATRNKGSVPEPAFNMQQGESYSLGECGQDNADMPYCHEEDYGDCFKRGSNGRAHRSKDSKKQHPRKEAEMDNSSQADDREFTSGGNGGYAAGKSRLQNSESDNRSWQSSISRNKHRFPQKSNPGREAEMDGYGEADDRDFDGFSRRGDEGYTTGKSMQQTNRDEFRRHRSSHKESKSIPDYPTTRSVEKCREVYNDKYVDETGHVDEKKKYSIGMRTSHSRSPKLASYHSENVDMLLVDKQRASDGGLRSSRKHRSFLEVEDRENPLGWSDEAPKVVRRKDEYEFNQLEQHDSDRSNPEKQKWGSHQDQRRLRQHTEKSNSHVGEDMHLSDHMLAAPNQQISCKYKKNAEEKVEWENSFHAPRESGGLHCAKQPKESRSHRTKSRDVTDSSDLPTPMESGTHVRDSGHGMLHEKHPSREYPSGGQKVDHLPDSSAFAHPALSSSSSNMDDNTHRKFDVSVHDSLSASSPCMPASSTYSFSKPPQRPPPPLPARYERVASLPSQPTENPPSVSHPRSSSLQPNLFREKQDSFGHSHVHPKLPDYEDLVASFAALKQKKLKK